MFIMVINGNCYSSSRTIYHHVHISLSDFSSSEFPVIFVVEMDIKGKAVQFLFLLTGKE